MNKNNIKFIIKTIVIMMIMFIIISPFVLNRNYKIDEVSAFRSLNEIDPNCIMFDDEAIALAESATDILGNALFIITQISTNLQILQHRQIGKYTPTLGHQSDAVFHNLLGV